MREDDLTGSSKRYLSACYFPVRYDNIKMFVTKKKIEISRSGFFRPMNSDRRRGYDRKL